MEHKTKQIIFRVLFVIAILYHIWSAYNYGISFTNGKSAFSIISYNDILNGGDVGSLLVLFVITTLVNVANYLIQVGLPLLFFYLGWIKK